MSSFRHEHSKGGVVHPESDDDEDDSEDYSDDEPRMHALASDFHTTSQFEIAVPITKSDRHCKPLKDMNMTGVITNLTVQASGEASDISQTFVKMTLQSQTSERVLAVGDVRLHVLGTPLADDNYMSASELAGKVTTLITNQHVEGRVNPALGADKFMSEMLAKNPLLEPDMVAVPNAFAKEVEAYLVDRRMCQLGAIVDRREPGYMISPHSGYFKLQQAVAMEIHGYLKKKQAGLDVENVESSTLCVDCQTISNSLSKPVLLRFRFEVLRPSSPVDETGL